MADGLIDKHNGRDSAHSLKPSRSEKGRLNPSKSRGEMSSSSNDDLQLQFKDNKEGKNQ